MIMETPRRIETYYHLAGGGTLTKRDPPSVLFFSQSFLFVFLPIVLAGALFLSRVRGAVLVVPWLAVTSIVFYLQDGWRHGLLLALSIGVNWLVGAALMTARPHPRAAKMIFIAGVVFDVGLLAIFKYLDFFIRAANDLTGWHGAALGIILPVGVSFYTFTQIAYISDVYLKRHDHEPFVPYVLFVTFFPHLIAGPIIHHKEMMPQFHARRRISLFSDEMAQGWLLFAIGLFKKLVLADTLALFADRGFARGAVPGVGDAWLASLAYTFQLYFDFSGYADMAVGLALMFGILLPFNFNSPYKALNIQDFWRRWHMTLSRWLRDYVYIPLGGNRDGELRMLANLVIVFLIGGLWHGAAWTFVVWGALHGVAIVVHRLWTKFGLAMAPILAVFLTFLFVNATWVPFRATDSATAMTLITAMAGFAPSPDVVTLFAADWQWLTAALALSAAIVWTMPNSQTLVLGGLWRIGWLSGVATGTAVFVALIRASGGETSPFLYFNF